MSHLKGLTAIAPPVVAVFGATATGKSALAVNLACKLRALGSPAEVIGADAMQLYRGMDIGTAKLTAEEMRGVPHHQIDVLDPREEASVFAYKNQVAELISKQRASGIVPIVAGGSGLYVNAALYDLEFAPHSSSVREELETYYAEKGLQELQRLIEREDPEAAKGVDLRNPRRIIRALEIKRITGKSAITSLPEAPKLKHPTLLVHTVEDRATLVNRIDTRVEAMWADGIIDEVKRLEKLGIREGKTASQAIGYAQALQQLDGEIIEAAAIAETQLLTRRYARRQVSWFKRLALQKEVSSADSRSELAQTALLADILKIWRESAS
ncbi:tRNA (adenosine(37)-N6)-dimethylallyltransferase MiaA [Canibacter zhoujuaniae]|uniref:tRNA (adenosine(37)-N6)-dimethylallyltransferase MiaA n=1 Tax=Canibacter zhoujuaniae TaxID=2708343 RepID=UPI00141FB84B|nr:tRNA (adenosine(37)-N6)-dimethylallyltransferase MiaA [Canibacter zhoujuaniae]